MLTEAIVASVIAGSSVCSDHFDNPNRFNPTELSDYQECVLAAHSDESAGVLGSIFWTKIGETEFVSMPVRSLQMAGSKDAAIKKVMKKAAVGIAQADYDALIEQRDNLLTKLGDAEELAATRLTRIGTIQGELNRIREFQEGIADETIDIIIPGVTTPTNDTPQHTLPVDTELDEVDQDVTRMGTYVAYAHRVFNNGDNTVNPDLQIATNLLGTTGLVDTTHPQWNELTSAVTDAVNDAYNDGYQNGYDDGYQAGYSTGYNSGFEAGVASVN